MVDTFPPRKSRNYFPQHDFSLKRGWYVKDNLTYQLYNFQFKIIIS